MDVAKTNLFHKNNQGDEDRITDGFLRVLLRSDIELFNTIFNRLGIDTSACTDPELVIGNTRKQWWHRSDNSDRISLNGEPDMILDIPNGPLLLIEVKWGDQLDADQINRYYSVVKELNNAHLIVITKREGDRERVSNISEEITYISWQEVCQIIRLYCSQPDTERFSKLVGYDYLDLMATKGVGIMTFKKIPPMFDEETKDITSYFRKKNSMEANRREKKALLESFLSHSLQKAYSAVKLTCPELPSIEHPIIPSYSERSHTICSRSALEISESALLFAEYFIEVETPKLRITWLLNKIDYEKDLRLELKDAINEYKSSIGIKLDINRTYDWENSDHIEYSFWLDPVGPDWKQLENDLVQHGKEILLRGKDIIY
jgi:hypothetical protein